jgi:hypothetical protein
MITYKKPVAAKSFFTKRFSQNGESSVCLSSGEEESIPLFQKARAVLGARLSYHIDTGLWAVDGKPLPIVDVIDLANSLQTRRGNKKLLSYPRVATRYDYGLCGMMIAHK